MLIVHLFVSYAHVNLCYFFLFLLVSGVGCDFCVWLFLDFYVYLFTKKVHIFYIFDPFQDSTKVGTVTIKHNFCQLLP